MPNNIEIESRRRWLVQALRLGLLGAGGALAPAARGQSSGRSIHRMSGEVLVNAERAGMDTPIRPGDEVRTRRDASVVFVVGEDAYHLRGSSRMQLEGEGALTRALRLLSGKLLSVFGSRETTLRTSIATIGIRGTGVYLEAEADRSYLCTCYGDVSVQANDDPASREAISTTHHNAPRYVLASGAPGTRIRPAPMIGHEDSELYLLESLVGREPPFSVFGEYFNTPRRMY